MRSISYTEGDTLEQYYIIFNSSHVNVSHISFFYYLWRKMIIREIDNFIIIYHKIYGFSELIVACARSVTQRSAIKLLCIITITKRLRSKEEYFET